MIKSSTKAIVGGFITLSLLQLSIHSAYAQASNTDSIAERMLVYQRSYGGWPKAVDEKKVDYNIAISPEEKKDIQKNVDADDATIDNKATSREIIYLIKAYTNTKNSAYLAAARKGIDYVLKAQYPNGGWPQYYPRHNIYRGEITFNDDAMINVLNILEDIAEQQPDYVILGEAYQKKAQQAVAKGVDCILRTQVVINGVPTIWAGQYDQNTLKPAKARAFELPALSTSESSNIIRFLMRIKDPTKEIVHGIETSVAWFDKYKIEGYNWKVIDDASQPKGKDKILVKEEGSVIWARFYDLDKQEPQFVGRDSQPKKTLAEIENERRVGYAWYGTWGAKLPKEYIKWKKANNME
jgi:PelA/Pel-15E family pectate lyase